MKSRRRDSPSRYSIRRINSYPSRSDSAYQRGNLEWKHPLSLSFGMISIHSPSARRLSDFVLRLLCKYESSSDRFLAPLRDC